MTPAPAPVHDPVARRLALAALVLAAVAFLSGSLDRPLTEAMLALPAAWAAPAKALTDLGKSHWYLVPAGLLALGAGAVALRLPALRDRPWWGLAELGGFVFAAIAVSGILIDILKPLLGRARPKLLALEEFYGYRPLTFDADFYSLPSGHANTLLVLATLVALLAPRWRRWAFGVFGLLALTRVVVGAHYLSDVVAGGAIAVATTLALAAWAAERGWVLRRRRDGRLALNARQRWLKRHRWRWRVLLGLGVKAARETAVTGP